LRLGSKSGLSCHGAVSEIKGKTDLTVALAGNPNVGKSCLFNQLTGLNVVTANYPGKTVTLNLGTTRHGETLIGLIDLPGTYALGAVSDDQLVARRGLLDCKPDVVIEVVDASNLQRNLYMALQFMELGFPLVICLNLVDYAAMTGIEIDHTRLERILNVPVVPAVAVRGEGVDETIHAALTVAKEKTWRSDPPKYSERVEAFIKRLQEAVEKDLTETPFTIPPRALAVLLLEGDVEFIEGTRQLENGERVLELASSISKEIEETYGEPPGTRIAKERHEAAGAIVASVQKVVLKKEPLSERLRKYTVSTYTGIPIMIGVLLSVFLFT
jgi:ferrous iron transport protein B